MLEKIRKILEFHKALGIDHYPAGRLAPFLAKTPPSAPAKQPLPAAATAGRTPDKTKKQARPAPQVSARSLDEIRRELGECTRCSLHQGGSGILFGQGSASARLLLIGEWPTLRDDKAGKLFSGQEGVLLEKMLAAINVDLDQCYLTNLVKCRAEEENPPDKEQLAACRPFLDAQIETVAPAVICTLGPLAAHAILDCSVPLVRLRGRFHHYKSLPVMPTLHPSYLLKNEHMKRAVWHDLQAIEKKLKE